MVLEFTKLEYHIIFFNRTNFNSTVPRRQNWLETRVSETRILEKVVFCHLFPKQCFFAKNFQKMWYLAILAQMVPSEREREKKSSYSSFEIFCVGWGKFFVSILLVIKASIPKLVLDSVFELEMVFLCLPFWFSISQVTR